MSVIKMGVIGVGGIARGCHIPGILRSPDAELVAVCDINPDVLTFAKEQYGLADDRLFSDYRELLASPLVDAVSICTPNNMHVQIALEAVRCRKPFAVEKPLSVNETEAKKLDDAIAESGLANMICFSYRFKAAARYARDLIAEGKLGTLRHVYARYMQGWGAPNLNCPKVWRFDKTIGGSGTLGDLGSHMLDLVSFMTDSHYTDVTAKLGTFTFERPSIDPAKNGTLEPVDVDDYSHYFCTTDSGIATSFEITRNAYGRGNYQRVEVYGDEGALIYELENADTLDVCFGSESRDSHSYTRVEIPDKYRVDQMQCFFDLVNGNDTHSVAHVRDGYINQQMLDTIIRSDAEGRALSIK